MYLKVHLVVKGQASHLKSTSRGLIIQAATLSCRPFRLADLLDSDAVAALGHQ
jgi:hypothetical protein